MSRVWLLVFSLFVAANSVYALRHPFHNWDMLAYIACALSYEESDHQVIHERTYAAAKEYVSPEKYHELISQFPFRRDVADSAEHFYQQLSYYQIKPLYGWLIFILYRLGIPLGPATVWVSVVSVALLCFVILWWLSEHFPPTTAFLMSLLVIIATRLTGLGRVSTPDALSAAIVFAAMFMIFEKKWVHAGIIVALIAITARLDSLIIVFPVIVFLMTYAPPEYAIRVKPGCVYLAIALLAYYCINHFADSGGVWVYFYHSFIERVLVPADFDVPFSLRTYLVVLIRGIKGLIWDLNPLSTTLSIFLLLVLLVFRFSATECRVARMYRHLILIVLGGLVVHFLVYPDLQDRHFVTHHLIFATLCLITLAKCIRGRSPDHPEAREASSPAVEEA